MKRTAGDFLIGGLITVTPIPGAMLASLLIKDDETAQAYGLIAAAFIVFGIFFIPTIGVIVHVFTKNKPKGRLYSLLGFLIPAVLVIAFEFQQALFNT